MKLNHFGWDKCIPRKTSYQVKWKSVVGYSGAVSPLSPGAGDSGTGIPAIHKSAAQRVRWFWKRCFFALEKASTCSPLKSLPYQPENRRQGPVGREDMKNVEELN